MDPTVCLLEARTAYLEGNYETAAEYLSDYREWRAKGGFQPRIEIEGDSFMGDDFVLQLRDGYNWPK